MRVISMLSRLRAVYECFRTVALSFPEISKIEIRYVSPPQCVSIEANRFRKRLRKLAEVYGLSKTLSKRKEVQSIDGARKLHVHAEMQVLFSLMENPTWLARSHRYIGTSKRLCFLCSQVLRKYSMISIHEAKKVTFETRESHQKVYDLWTLPHAAMRPGVASIAMGTSVICTYKEIQARLNRKLILQQAIPESSAGITDIASISTQAAAERRRYINKQRTLNSTSTADEHEAPVALGRRIRSARVGCLPADGSSPRLITVQFYAPPDKAGRRIQEAVHAFIPNFHDCWGEYQWDRRYRLLTLENQALREQNGKYRVYWNENPELPENEHIKSLLDIEEVDAFRRFWFGDVFIVRYCEGKKSSSPEVLDARRTILWCQGVQATFQHMWDEKFLENELDGDRYFGAHQEKVEADKELIFQRMLVWGDRRWGHGGANDYYLGTP